MKFIQNFRRLFLFLPLALLFLPAPSLAESLREILPNGLEVVVLKNPGTSSVSVDLWVKAGSRYEPPELNGISHLVEHLLFKGTQRRTAQDISREIAGVGGMTNAYTTWEYTQVHIAILPPHLELALDVLADMAQNSKMTEEMVAKEKKVVLEEIALANIFPPSYVLSIVSRTLFPGNSLGMPICGTRKTVGDLKRKDLLNYYHRHYVPNNCLLAVVGNVDPPAAMEKIRKKLSSWTRKDNLPDVPFPPHRQKRSQEISERRFLDQAIVVLTCQAMGLKDIDRPAFEIINTILGSGGNSRLYQEIREKRALAYLVGSLYHPLSDTGLWGTYVGTDPKNVEEVKGVIAQQIRKIQEEPLSLQELENVKNYIRGRLLIRNESNSALADFVSQACLCGSLETPAEFISRVQEVTPADVMRVARIYLREDQCNLIVLRPYPGLMLFRGLL